jgi:succinyl-CoA synthetase beta subunit
LGCRRNSSSFGKIEIKVPLVIRLAGTNVEKGNKILQDSKLIILKQIHWRMLQIKLLQH